MNFIFEENRIYFNDENGKLLAEITFPFLSESAVNINHTFVDDSLRGQGIASKLVQAAADEIRKRNLKAHVSCSYAVKWFEKHTEYNDIIK